MKNFRFVILGAGNIAGKFCDAVRRTEGCTVAAVASKSGERASAFAGTHGIEHAYGSYEEMLDREQPDCAYIAVTPNDHYRLSMMCIERKIPVLCEKAMFQNSREAREVFALAKEKGVFVMEALWSRFLPAVKQAKAWLTSGRIGSLEFSDISIGFRAPEEETNRYYNPALGGGAAKDITVYAYELTTFMVEEPILGMQVDAVWGPTGVDLTDQVSIRFAHAMAALTTTFACRMEERMVLYGKEGSIVIPGPHYASECFLYDKNGELKEHFRDEVTENGFTYEVEEAVRCIRAGAIESGVVPHAVTLACAELFDRIEETRKEG